MTPVKRHGARMGEWDSRGSQPLSLLQRPRVISVAPLPRTRVALAGVPARDLPLPPSGHEQDPTRL